jgi:hypothetical protein
LASGALLAARSLSAGAALAQPEAASSQPAQPVVVALPRCERLPYDAAELSQALELELAQRGLEAGAEGSGAVQVIVELTPCDPGNTTLGVRVLPSSGQPLAERPVQLADTPFEARARTLALLIAESLDEARLRTSTVTAAADDELPALALEAQADAGEAPAAPVSDVDQRPSSEPRIQRPAGDPTSLQLGAALQARSSLSRLQPFWGVEAQLRAPAFVGFDWAAEAAFGTHTEETQLGDFGVRWWSISGGVDWSQRGALGWRLGPRLSFAHVSSNADAAGGTSPEGQSFNLALLGARAGLDVSLGGAWQLVGALELQRALRGLVLTAGGEPSVALDGFIVSAGLGVSHAF